MTDMVDQRIVATAFNDLQAHLEIQRLRELLGRLEWAGERAMFAACPVCEEWQERGHLPDCWLAQELGIPPGSTGE